MKRLLEGQEKDWQDILKKQIAKEQPGVERGKSPFSPLPTA